MRLAQLQGINSPSSVFTSYQTLGGDVLSRLLLFAMFAAGFIFFIRIIIAGFTLLSARGDPGKIQSATQSLTNGLIGLVIVVTSFFITQILEAVFGLRII